MADVDMRKGYNPVTIMIYDRKKNILFKEISLIALDRKNNKVIATGNDVLQLIDNSDSNIFVTSPLKYGIIADYQLTQMMFRCMLQKFKSIFKPKIAFCIHTDITEVERKAFQEAFYQSGVKEILISDKSIEEMNQSLPASYSVLIEIVQAEKSGLIKKEIWKEVYKDKIPNGIYHTISISNHELGIIISLSSSTHCVQMSFDKVVAMRMFEKRVIPDNLFADDELKKLSKDKFKNVIYQINNGEFSTFLKDNENQRGKVLNMNSNHYIIISEYYTVEVLSETEPNIIIEDM